MARDEGFAVADVSTAMLTDPKYRALWRDLQDEAAMNAAGQVYLATQLASWQHGERVKAEDAAPFWMLDVTEAVDALVRHGLLDTTHRIPQKPWRVWFGTASKRRRQARDRWRRAKDRPETNTDIRADSTRNTRGGGEESANPSVPPVRPVPTVLPSSRSALPRIGDHGVKDTSKERNEAVARALAKLNDPTASEDVKRAARYALERMGAA